MVPENIGQSGLELHTMGQAADTARRRLDVEMVRRGLAESRERAQRLIMAGRVRVDAHTALKADLRVSAANALTLLGGDEQYASRGAYKLLAALDHFRIDVRTRQALDVGASTGGFTDVLIRRGAARVIALDVGYGQLDLRLRSDAHVTVLDRTNIRFCRPEDLPYPPDLVTIDTSFISLRLVLPAVLKLAAASAEIVALVKPQFEAGRRQVGKGGIVRDPSVRARVVREFVDFARGLRLEVMGVIESPLTGARGNVESLAYLKRRA